MNATLTKQQTKSLEDMLFTARKAQETGAITYSALHDVVMDTAHTLEDAALAVCHGLVWAEYEKDNTLGLLRAVLSALSITHYRRLLAAHETVPTADLFKLWEDDTTDEMLDPVRLERNYASVYHRILNDRVIEKLGGLAGHDVLDKIIDDFPEGPADEELPARLARYTAHEIAALHTILD